MHSHRPRWRQRLSWTHRDTIWLLVVLVGTFALLLALKFKDSSEVTGFFSFAGTLVSIILGVLAIFYSTVQGSDSNQIIGEMRTKLEQVSADTQVLRTNLQLIPEPLKNKRTGAEPPVESPPLAGTDSAFELMRRVLRRSVEGISSDSIATVTRQQLVETAVRSDVSYKDALNGFDALVDGSILRQNTLHTLIHAGEAEWWEVDVARLRAQ